MREGLARTGDLLTRRVALTSPGGSRGPTEGEPAGEPIEVTNVSCTTSQHLPFYIELPVSTHLGTALTWTMKLNHAPACIICAEVGGWQGSGNTRRWQSSCGQCSPRLLGPRCPHLLR